MISNGIFAAAFENLRNGVLLLEKSTGRVTEANPAFLRICGRPRSAVVGRIFWAPPLIDDAQAGAEVLEHLRAGGRVERYLVEKSALPRRRIAAVEGSGRETGAAMVLPEGST